MDDIETPSAEARAVRLLPRNASKAGWYNVRNASDGVAEISIYDEIGGYGLTAKSFIEAVQALGQVKALDVHLNSPGGSVFEGLVIYNFLKRIDAEVTVYIDGLAASIASLIAMAGRVVMPENALLMLHNASGVAMGTAEDMLAMATALEKINASLVTVYTAKTGKSGDEIAAMMAAETWLTAAEAVELGFADEMIEPVRMAASFDVSHFANAPDFLAQAAEEVAEPEPEVIEEVEPERDYHAEAVEIAAICAAANANAAEFIAAKAVPADVQAKLDTIGKIRDMCARANAPADLTAKLKGSSIEDARAALFDHLINSQSPEILTANTTEPAASPTSGISASEIYARRNKSNSR